MALWVLVFLSAAAIDASYVLWFHWSERGHAVRAASASVAIGAFGLLGLVSIVESRWLVIPDLAGLFAGTWIAIKSRPAFARWRARSERARWLVPRRAPVRLAARAAFCEAAHQNPRFLSWQRPAA